jgi:hypothetical protein
VFSLCQTLPPNACDVIVSVDEGLRCLTVQLRETEIEALIHKGLLQFETRHSKSEIIKALHDFFDLTLSSNR